MENMHATVDYEDDTWAMLGFGDVKMALTVATQHPPHIGFEVASLEELGDNNNIKKHRCGSHYLSLEDPDGTVLETINGDQ